jgi:ABC-type uncharacterized transport system substrate-binding protein
MKRREFISLMGGVAGWPLAAWAQQTERMRRIGVMMGVAEGDREGQQQVDAFRQGLKDLGWTDGRNMRMDFQWGVAQPGRAQPAARDIIAAQPDLIVSHSTPGTTAIVQLTKTISIVFLSVPDPVALGFVSSFAHPGGNVTGFTSLEPSMGGKWVEVLKDLNPRIGRVAILFNPETAPAGGKYYLPSFKAAGAALGVETIEAVVHDAAGIGQAIDSLAREPNGGLIAMADVFTALNRELIVRSALDHRLPLIASFRTFTEQGGLISYGSDNIDPFHRAASYVDRILKGEKSADLPIQAPTRFEMAINLKTAKALGLTISRDFLLRVDEVIE